MPKASPIFPTFSSGEVSPLLYGRVDLQQYFNGLKDTQNCLVRPYGLIMSRPGLEFIAPVKTPSKFTRLLEFVFNESDAFIIEMGDLYFRFYSLGASVTEGTQAFTAGGSTQADPVLINMTAHLYTNGDTVIIEDVVGMTELNGNRYLVANANANDFTIQDLDGVDIDGTGFTAYVSGGTADKVYEVVHTYTEAELPDVHYAQVNDVIYLAHGTHKPATLTRMATNNWVLADITFIGGPVMDENITATTITPSSDTGATTLTASSPLFNSDHIGSTWKIKDGFVNITGFTSTTIINGTVEDVSLGTGPGATTEWNEGSWSDAAGWPATLTFHERRLWYARTATQPQTEWASKPFIYDDFTAGALDDDALDVTLNTEQANDIKWLSSGTTLATGTFGGEFVTSSGANGISLTPSNVNSIRQTGWGSRNIQPKKIGNFIYYIQRAGRKVRELFYYFDQDTYKSVDMNIISEHITESGITDMTYQQNPDSTLHCIRGDGNIASFVREEDQQVKAWSKQVTDGDFESIASIPSNLGDYDEVWVVVERTINAVTRRYVERFEDPVVPDRQEDCFYVDSGLRYDAYTLTTGVSLTLSAITGVGVTATAGSAYFVTNDIGQRIRAIDENGDYIGELKITAFTSSTIVVGTVTLDFTTTTYVANRWGLSAMEIDGLDHLEAKSVAVLADGGVQTQKTVSGGMISIDRDAFELTIGLPYQARIETLSIEAGSATGTSQGKRKRIYQLALKVFKTLGIKVGTTDNNLFNVTQRNPVTLMGTPEPLISDVIPNLRGPGGWTWEAGILIVQDNPLPMHILDIMPLINEEDR